MFVSAVWLTPDKFYKRSQGKNSFPAAGFFLAVQPTSFEQDCSGFPFHDLGTLLRSRSALGFPCQRFSSLSRNEASLFGDHKQHGCQVPTMVLLGTRGP
jgi:hypothetical protein